MFADTADANRVRGRHARSVEFPRNCRVIDARPCYRLARPGRAASRDHHHSVATIASTRGERQSTSEVHAILRKISATPRVIGATFRNRPLQRSFDCFFCPHRNKPVPAVCGHRLFDHNGETNAPGAASPERRSGLMV
jgi:hypothetical protein